MEREDRNYPQTEVTLIGNAREAELIVAGLNLLSAEVMIRDVLDNNEQSSKVHPRVPKQDEITKLLRQIGAPNYSKK